MPKPVAPFNFTACIGKAGDQTCPAPFTKKHLYYTDFDDTRGCSTCNCDKPVGGLCDVTINFYSTASCTGTPVVSVVAGQSSCANLPMTNPTIAGRSGMVTAPPSGASCSPISASSSVTGVVAARASTETTFCCF